MKKKKILVIGSESDIAKAILKILRAGDYEIITASRKDAGADIHYRCDTSDSDSVQKLIWALQDNPIDWVIYCAGYIADEERVGNLDKKYFETSQNVNFLSAVTIIDALTSSIETGGGVVCLSSTAGIWGHSHYPLYSAWKSALNVFLQSLNKQWTESGKYAFALCPGPTNTKMREAIAGDSQEHQSPDMVAKYAKQIIEQPKQYATSPIFVVQKGMLYAYTQELHAKEKNEESS